MLIGGIITKSNQFEIKYLVICLHFGLPRISTRDSLYRILWPGRLPDYSDTIPLTGGNKDLIRAGFDTCYVVIGGTHPLTITLSKYYKLTQRLTFLFFAIFYTCFLNVYTKSTFTMYIQLGKC